MQYLGRLAILKRKFREPLFSCGAERQLHKLTDGKTSTNRICQVIETRRCYHDLNGNGGDSIVISGISGRFASAENMKELKQNLLEGVDLIGSKSKPVRMDLLKNPDKFDADFFGVSCKTAESLDPLTRQLLEVCYEAIFDAGINPASLRGTGTRTGLYIGMQGGEGHESLGGINSMTPARVSCLLDLMGPRAAAGTGCLASVAALEAAAQAVIKGSCERALVAGAVMKMGAKESIKLAATNALSKDATSRSKPFDAKGIVPSEAIVVMLIEKKRDAKREYATVRAVQTGPDSTKPDENTFPSIKSQTSLMKELCSAAGIDPGHINYLEAHGVGTLPGDTQELLSIEEAIAEAPNRKEKLLIGSVKSNVGHTGSAAGLVSIAKLIIANEAGVIPANHNFETPNTMAAAGAGAAFDGSLEIVATHKPWKGGLVGIGSYGIGGSAAHVILEFPSTAKCERTSQSPTESPLPMLIPFAGRTPELTRESLCEICDDPGKDLEAAHLIQEVFRTRTPGQDYRGFAIIPPGDATPTIEVNGRRFDSSVERPLWYVFTGGGSQWNEMGKDMMHIDVYAESIRKTEMTLKNIGVDLQHLLRPNNPSIFSSLTDQFIVIISLQIALFDTLKSMGLEPEGFFGHSGGEVMCAYADGCYSAEETVLVAHARGRGMEESCQVPGGTAAVRLSWEEAVAKCPPEIDVACHNAADNVSITGPIEAVRKCMESFKEQGIFVREVNTSGYAPHGRYAEASHATVVKYVEEITGKGKPRSSRWISTSVPEAEWDSEQGRTASPLYSANNVVKPVLFHEAAQKIPQNAIVIEVGPEGALLPLLRSSLHSNCTVLAPIHPTVEDKLSFFLSTVGQMYTQGLDLNIGNLYPTVNLPVRSTTPNLSSLVKWSHEKSWHVPSIKK